MPVPIEDINFKKTLQDERNKNQKRNQIIAGIIFFVVLVCVLVYITYQKNSQPKIQPEILPNTSLSSFNSLDTPEPNLNNLQDNNTIGGVIEPSTQADKMFDFSLGKKDSFYFPSLNIKAPVVWSSLSDLYEKNIDGSIDINKPIIEKESDIRAGNYTSTPIQKLLSDGIVHLADTVQPGEIGNSYFVGRNSGERSIISNYNYVFAKLNQTKENDEFIIFDKTSKKLTFKVFEVVTIDQTDVATAYKNFGTKRVLTLQTNVLVNGKPLKRLLVRGELIPSESDENNNQDSNIYTLTPTNVEYKSCGENNNKVQANQKVSCRFTIFGFDPKNKYFLDGTWQTEIVSTSKSGRSDNCKLSLDTVICDNCPPPAILHI